MKNLFPVVLICLSVFFAEGGEDQIDDDEDLYPEIPAGPILDVNQLLKAFSKSSLESRGECEDDILKDVIQSMFENTLSEFEHLIPTDDEIPEDRKALMNEFKRCLATVLKQEPEKWSANSICESAINFGFSSIDPYFSYVSQITARKLKRREELGNPEGFGLILKWQSWRYYVTGRPNTPTAEKLNGKWELLSVNGVTVKGRSTGEVIGMFRAEAGSTVELRVEKVRQKLEEERRFQTVNIQAGAGKRDGFEFIAGESKIILRELSPAVLGELKQVAGQIQSDQITLDLREFTGSKIDVYVSLAELFLNPNDFIVQFGIYLPDPTKPGEKSLRVAPPIRAKEPPLFSQQKIKILQSAFTASSGEALIVALDASDRIELTTEGQKTFGKAIVATSVPLQGGGEMSFSTKIMVNPNGQTWEDIGLAPDELVSESE